MKSTFIIILLLFTIQLSAQEKKIISMHFNIGTNLSNLYNSEAPYKINIYDPTSGLLVSYDILAPDPDQAIKNSIQYMDYKTSLLKDLKIGLSLNTGLEYYLTNKLSVDIGLAYDQKGISLDYRKTQTINFDVKGNALVDENGNIIYENPAEKGYSERSELFTRKFKNSYISVPVCLNKYFGNGNFGVKLGAFVSVLMQSKIDVLNRKYGANYFSDQLFSKYDYSFGINTNKKGFTSSFDYGIVLGTNYKYPITNNLSFRSNLLMNIGLNKIDKKYNNDYSDKRLMPPEQFGYQRLIVSRNYFGLNSNARNISLMLTFGLEYEFNR